MLTQAHKYREVSDLSRLTSGDTSFLMYPTDLVDVQEIESGIDRAAKLGRYTYTFHHSFSKAVQNYLLHFGFSIHGTENNYTVVSW